MSEERELSSLRLERRRRRGLILISLAVVGVAAIWFYANYRRKYPYGRSHCCIKQLATQLQIYAEDHGGRFPSGRATPEASLGLLYDGKEDFMIELLRGKTVPQSVTRSALRKGNLTSESTGWHYVEGLTLSDDPQLAIVWDKVGLDHNGQRTKGGAREVIFVGGATDFITDWPKFLEEQAKLLAARDANTRDASPALIGMIRLPSGQILSNYAGPYELETTEKSENRSGHGSESGTEPQLRWYRYDSDGQITMVLTLPEMKMRSKPVSFEVKDGRASPASIVFEMGQH